MYFYTVPMDTLDENWKSWTIQYIIAATFFFKSEGKTFLEVRISGGGSNLCCRLQVCRWYHLDRDNPDPQVCCEGFSNFAWSEINMFAYIDIAIYCYCTSEFVTL